MDEAAMIGALQGVLDAMRDKDGEVRHRPGDVYQVLGDVCMLVKCKDNSFGWLNLSTGLMTRPIVDSCVFRSKHGMNEPEFRAFTCLGNVVKIGRFINRKGYGSTLECGPRA